MKKFLKGLFAVSIIPLVMIGCTTSSHKGQTITTPDGKRIFIPQEKISFDRPAPPKIIPYTYNAWMSVGDTLARVR